MRLVVDIALCNYEPFTPTITRSCTKFQKTIAVHISNEEYIVDNLKFIKELFYKNLHKLAEK